MGRNRKPKITALEMRSLVSANPSWYLGRTSDNLIQKVVCVNLGNTDELNRLLSEGFMVVDVVIGKEGTYEYPIYTIEKRK